MCAFKYVWGRNQWAHKIIRTLIFSFQIHFYKRETKNHVIRFFEELLNLAEAENENGQRGRGDNSLQNRIETNLLLYSRHKLGIGDILIVEQDMLPLVIETMGPVVHVLIVILQDIAVA